MVMWFLLVAVHNTKKFRRVEYIKSIAREPKRALSLKGRARALGQ